MILASTIFETGVKIATKIRREKNENCVEFSFHSISGLYRKNNKMHPKCGCWVIKCGGWRIEYAVWKKFIWHDALSSQKKGL